MGNNEYNANVVVFEAEQKNGFMALRVYEPEAKDSGYVTRFMDISIGDKSPQWMQDTAKTLKKGDRIHVAGTLRAKEGKTPGKTFESIQYLRRFAKLAPDNVRTRQDAGGLDDL